MLTLTDVLRRRLPLLAVVAATLSLGLTACVPGSTPGGAASPTAAATKGFDLQTPVTITVADGWGKTGTGATFGQVVDRFEARYPNVTVKRETTDYDSYTQSINLRGSSPNPPDVMMLTTSGYGQGFYQFVRSGLLLPLDGYAQAYDWASRFGDPANLDVFRMDSDDKFQWGTGTLYGLPEQNAMMTVYYNKALLAKAGLTAVPSTFAEFEQSLQTAKTRGITPIAQSNAYIHLQMALWNSMAAKAEPINTWVYGRDGGSFESPENLRAAQTITDWRTKGYFQDGVNTASYGDAAGVFLGGKALYYVAGSWMTGGVQESLKNSGGAFQLPTAEAGATAPVAGGFSTPLAISAKSKHPDVAAAFLDYFVSVENSDFLFTNGWGIPGATVSDQAAQQASLSREILAMLTPAQAAGGSGSTPFLDWATPGLTTQLPAALQEMASGVDSPSDYLTKIQADWQKFRDERRAD